MLYTIIFREKMESERYCIVSTRESLFGVLWSFEKNTNIIEYMVTCGNMTLTESSFGFGKMEKWVIRFNYPDTIRNK